jgi:hypothetical protein
MDVKDAIAFHSKNNRNTSVRSVAQIQSILILKHFYHAATSSWGT